MLSNAGDLPGNRRARALIERLLASREITPQGMNWLIAATDPFHDTEIVVGGYPDITSSKSLVQTITLQTEVTAGTFGGNAYDLSIFLLPCSQLYSEAAGSEFLGKYTFDNYGIHSGGTFSGPFLNSGLNIVQSVPGTSWTAATSNAVNDLRLPLTYCSGQFRIVGVGWEVVNTTPVVSMSGSVTAYKMPNAWTLSSMINNTTTAIDNPAPVWVGSLPPLTKTDATLYPNSRTWQASEGLYQIGTLNETQNKFVTPIRGYVAFMDPASNADVLANTPRVTYTCPGFGGDGNDSNIVQPFPWDISGAIFNGLTAAASFNITVKYFLERIPTTSDPNLLVLAKKSPSYDPVILEIYSRVVSELPVGVPVSENPLGEWFDKVMDVVADVLPTIGKGLSFIPGAELVASGLTSGARALKKYNIEERDKEAKTLKPTGNAIVLQGNGRQQTARVISNKQRQQQQAAAAKSNALRKERADLDKALRNLKKFS